MIDHDCDRLLNKKRRIMESDTQYEEHQISSVQKETGGGWSIGLDDECHFFVPADSPIEPQIGMTARLYGKGFGYSVRGLTLNGVVVFYRTEEEEREKHQREVEESQRKQRAEFEANREETDRRVAALPEVFQKRLDKFRANNDDFRWKYEPYELFVCEQAVVIAEALKTPEAIKAWHALSWDEQRASVPEISSDHSGNTFGMACKLAHLYLSQIEDVEKLHGALAPLVGSEEYGCVPKEGA